MPPNDQSSAAGSRPPALRFPDGRRPRIALVLQGGGALGAYQVGVFQALEETGIVPDWVSGISIGAINAALIVGNKPEDRLPRLTEFWETVSRPSALPVPNDVVLRKLYNVGSSTQAFMLGQPGFFEPRRLNPWLAAPGTPPAISFYDTAPLRATLNRLVDFQYLNNNRLRLSLGAVNVETGEQIYFDSAYTTITAEHVMASGALPPNFPPVRIGGDLCWDGGVLSNTPLFAVLDDQPRVDTLCFMVDLWDPVGPAPRTMVEVADRQKDIAYASHIRRHIENFRTLHDLRRSLTTLAAQLPAAAQEDPNLQRLIAMGCTTTMNIVHLLYRSRKYDTGTKDYEFSRASIADHRAAGYRDSSVAIEQSAWLEPVPAHIGVMVHEVFSHPDIPSMATPAAAAVAAGTPPKTLAARRILGASGKPTAPG